jgi:cell surface protein SprA
LKYDFSKSLSFEFNAGANAFINEPQIYPDKDTQEWEEYKQEIWREIGAFGTMQRYNQTFKVNYNLPFRKIPVLDWITAAASYTGLYSWSAAPLSVQKRTGNVIENSQQIQVNGNTDLNKLYNKVPYFKEINKTQSRSSRPSSRTRGTIPEPPDSEDTTAKPKKNYGKIIGDGFLRVLMLIKKASITYTEGNGTLLPGYLPEPDLLGLSFANSNAPGWGFVFGSQKDIRQVAGESGWITQDSILNQAFAKKGNKAFSYKLNTDILNAIRVDFDGDYLYTENLSAYYRYNYDSLAFIEYTPVTVGNFSISYSIIRTSFDQIDTAGNSATYATFLGDRQEIAYKLANDDPRWSGESTTDTLTGDQYPVGFGSNSQEVLYYSFLSAYSGQGTSINVSSPFPKFPIPNWRLTFGGLTNIKAIGKIFRTFNITHGYRSMLSIASWRTNVNYDETNPDNTFPNSLNFVTAYDIGVVSIIESYSPLIGVDMTLQNSLSLKVEYKKSRNLSLSFVNNQMTEIVASDIILGFGFRLKNLKFTIGSLDGSKSKNTAYNSDLNFKLDFGIRDSKTTLRRIDENNNQISAGSRQYNLNFSADYMLSQSLQIRFYYNWTSNNPYVSSQFPNSTTNGGISLRFNLAQ